ncbi:MAG: hypothetical protein FWE84_03605 [Firmicutes bacterium]|nr:hypothetical protein [Bacillota bacterium]
MKRMSLIISVCAVLVALTFVLGWIPYIGPFLLPTLFAACCLSLGISFFASTMFGVISLLFCYIVGPTSAIGWFFLEYPFVPIVARMFIGPIIYFFYKLLTKLIKPKNTAAKIAAISVAGAAGSLLNTVFVGIFLFTLDISAMPAGLKLLPWLPQVNFGLMELVVAGTLEIFVNALLLPPIVLGTKRAVPRLFMEINGGRRKGKEDMAEGKE